MTDQATDEAARTLVITRTINAPPHIVFLAHSKPEHVARWFGPVDYPLTKCEMDFREGGEFHFQMTGPDGVKGPPFSGTYLKIIPNELIRFDNGFDDNEPTGRMIMTTTLEPVDGGKTLLTLTTLFESQAMHDEFTGMGMEEGTNSGLDQLEEVTRELAAAA